MAKKSSKSVVNQIICCALILAALLGIVAIILVAEGTYDREGIWCGVATALVLALAGAWYGWNNAKLPGVGGKVAYILTVPLLRLFFYALSHTLEKTAKKCYHSDIKQRS